LRAKDEQFFQLLKTCLKFQISKQMWDSWTDGIKEEQEKYGMWRHVWEYTNLDVG
jgi:hypothetical protein